METSERNIEANMNELIGRIEAKYEKMSKGQKRLAEYVKENYDKAVFLTAARLGEIVGVSESTVVRFATQLGYRGYPEFQKALEELVRNKLNSIQRMEVTYGRITQSEILETVLQSDIEKIKMTLSAIDHKAFNWAIDTLLEAKRIYVVGIRSCAPLASFMGFYLNLVCDNVITVNTNSSSEIFEQIIRIGEGDVIIGISFPRYSMRTLKALEFASNRKAKVITLTDSIHSPMNQYSSCNLIARSDMASIVDSLVAPLSVINALVLCGAIPVYVNPAGDKRLGIPLGMRVEDVRRAIKENPDAKAVFVNNPTYYGICSDLRSIVKLAHEHGMLCLVDEAHGTHFYFGENMPVSAMAAGADMAAVSMHKSGGSLTQSSILLTGPGMSAGYVRQIINLTQTTSGSYLLLSSLDISRRNLALRGREAFKQVVELAEYARTEINRIGGYYAYSKELVNGDSIYDFDVTKLSIHTRDIGLAGIEVYDLLRDEYDIQAEFGDLGNILAYLSIGDRQREVERLVSALAEIKRRFSRDKSTLMDFDYIDPIVAMSPQEAFYGEKESLPIRETAGRVCSEFVMCYPPGIPILTPGEQITEEIIDYIAYALEKGCSMTGPEDPGIERLNVLK